jgi:hypothetical protein
MDDLVGFLDSFDDNHWICENCGKQFSKDYRTGKSALRGKEDKKPRFCRKKCALDSRYKDKFIILDKWRRGEKVSSEMSMADGRVRVGELTKFFWSHCRDIVMRDQKNECNICGIPPKWSGSPLTFILDHIDGNPTNHNRNNLRMICPNCNSQLETTSGKKKSGGRFGQRVLYYQMRKKIDLDNTLYLSESEWNRRRDLLLKYDRSIRGWKRLAVKQTGLSAFQIDNVFKHFNM